MPHIMTNNTLSGFYSVRHDLDQASWTELRQTLDNWSSSLVISSYSLYAGRGSSSFLSMIVSMSGIMYPRLHTRTQNQRYPPQPLPVTSTY